MGAVYALFASIYLYLSKFLGYLYFDLFGHLHFWLFTLAINLLFFPMHFLGLAAMPRRIPDYPFAFSYWNNFMTFGSFISFLSLFFFLLSLYHLG